VGAFMEMPCAAIQQCTNITLLDRTGNIPSQFTSFINTITYTFLSM
jgi:hypothetical protein